VAVSMNSFPPVDWAWTRPTCPESSPGASATLIHIRLAKRVKNTALIVVTVRKLDLTLSTPPIGPIPCFTLWADSLPPPQRVGPKIYGLPQDNTCIRLDEGLWAPSHFCQSAHRIPSFPLHCLLSHYITIIGDIIIEVLDKKGIPGLNYSWSQLLVIVN